MPVYARCVRWQTRLCGCQTRMRGALRLPWQTPEFFCDSSSSEGGVSLPFKEVAPSAGSGALATTLWVLTAAAAAPLIYW